MKIKGFVTREEAGLVPPRSFSRNITPEKGGFTVHWAGNTQRIGSHADCIRRWRAYQKFHMETRGYADIAYNVGFCRHCYVFAGRGVNVRSGANGTNVGNRDWYAGCWIGGLGDLINSESVAALEWCINTFRETGNAGERVVPHSFHKTTTCPGDEWRDWVKNFKGITLPPEPPVDDEDEEMDPVLVEQIKETNSIQRALLTERIASYRQLVGLPPEPGSDLFWVNHIAKGTRTITDAYEAIKNKAEGQ